MTERKTRRRSILQLSRPLQPLISLTPCAAAFGIRARLLRRCPDCSAALASHFDRRNRWTGCKAGAR